MKSRFGRTYYLLLLGNQSAMCASRVIQSRRPLFQLTLVQAWPRSRVASTDIQSYSLTAADIGLSTPTAAHNTGVNTACFRYFETISRVYFFLNIVEVSAC